MAQKRKHRIARRGEVTVADMVFMDLGIGPHRRRRKQHAKHPRRSKAWLTAFRRERRRRQDRSGRWIQKALRVRRRRVRHHLRVMGAHKGALHRQLGIPSGKKITTKRLQSALKEARFELRHAENAREKKAARKFLGRVQFAINARKFKRKRSH